MTNERSLIVAFALLAALWLASRLAGGNKQ